MQHHKLHLTTRFKVTAVIIATLLVAIFCFFLVHYAPEAKQAMNEAVTIDTKDNAELIRGIAETEAKEVEPQGDGEDFTDEHESVTDEYHEPVQQRSEVPLKDNTAAESAISVFEGHAESAEATTHPVISQQNETSKTFVADAPHPPLSKYEVKAGTLVPAILETSINSDLPGNIIAKVSQNVYDTVTGNYLLLPQGTTLLGAYDPHIEYGQQRALVVWNRMIFPNGSSMQLEGQAGVDLVGHAGLHDKVNNHYMRLYGNAMMFSLLSAAGQLSQPQKSGDKVSPQEMLYASVGQQMVQVSSQSIAKNLSVQPTIEIRSGTHFNVMLGQDLILPDVYHFQEQQS